MRFTRLVVLSALVCATAAQTQERHDHPGGAGNLGEVSFANSGAAAAQAPFLRGLALLHSFEYGEAAEAFREAQKADASFAMAYWGEALTYAHLLWGEDDPAAARAALARLAASPGARLAKAGTARERAYGSAIEALFVEASPAVRTSAFADSMRRVAAAYPDDVDATTFTALAVMFSEYGARRTPAQRAALRDEAITLAERAFLSHPQHPGSAHYLIHATDDPAFAARGLVAARRYAAIAPDAEHALHMPSHIFLQLGLWDDVATTNERAWAASRAEIRGRGETNANLSFHALKWLQYAYLQQGRWRAARALVDTARAVLTGADLRNADHVDARYAIGALEFVYAANTGEWSKAACDVMTAPLAAPSGPSDRERSFNADAAAQSSFARIKCSGDTVGATSASGVAPNTRLVVDAAAAHHRGDYARAIELLVPLAAAPQGAPTGPPTFVRLHEVLGESLLDAKRPRESVAAYERALELTPSRSASLLGLARARNALGDRAGAASAYRQLLANWKNADGDLTPLRALLAEARAGAAR